MRVITGLVTEEIAEAERLPKIAEASGSRAEAHLSAEAEELKRKGLTNNGSVGSQPEEHRMRGRWRKL
jgi:hypothetical protein